MRWRRRKTTDPLREALALEVMEPRLLLSADALGVDTAVLDRDAQEDTAWDLQRASDWWAAGEASADSTVEAAVPAETPAARSIVFLDAAVADGERLLADLLARTGAAGDAVQVFLLDGGSDGVEQVTRALAGQQGLDAIHILSHGAAGQIQLGNATLSAGSLDGYAGQLNDWGSALAEDGDLLFYGCDLAADEQGRALVDAIGVMTGADVAASVDQTGHPDEGGDWDLEYRVGTLETAAFSPGAVPLWQGTLATFTVNTTSDTVDANPGDGLAEDAAGNTSLRAAIMEANALAGADTINLDAATYTITLSGGNDDKGDFDIRDDLAIVGVSPALTVIDGAFGSTVFDVHDDAAITVSIENLKIQNGIAWSAEEQLGAGLNILCAVNTPNVFLDNVWFTANTASWFTTAKGGAIANAGNLTISNSLIDDNNADQGGGVYNAASGTLYMENVTVSGNATINGAGAGILNDGGAELRNVTVTGNSANHLLGTGEGGGIAVSAGSVDIANSIVAGNTAEGTRQDVSGGFVSSGSNIVQDATGSTGFDPGETGVDPLLGALADNGGQLKTHELLATSPAIDSADPVFAPNTDQRGFLRGDGSPDIGAYEAGSTVATTAHYLDEFVTGGSYAGDDGTLRWTNEWQEIGEADGPDFGNVQVFSRFGEQGIDLWKNPVGIWREADLSGATTATLSFDWGRLWTDAGDTVTLEISVDGGASWTVLDSFTGPATDSVLQSASYDISAFIDVDTRIKFETTNYGDNDEFFFDNVRIDLGSHTLSNLAPTADAGGDRTISEGDDLDFDGAGSSDADGSIALYQWDLNNDGSFEKAGVGGTFTWSDLAAAGVDDDGSYAVALRVTDDGGEQHTDVFTLTVHNAAPTLTASGTGLVVAGNVYSLDLSASDPGDDTITGYTINWGDGTVTTEAYAGPTTTVTHTYDQPGFTYNVTFSAVDEDAVAAGISWTSSELLVGNWVVGGDDVFRFEGSDGQAAGTLDSSGGLLDRPYAPVVGPDGNTYVSGYDSDNIVRYAPDGSYIDVFASGPLFNKPSGLAWGPDGALYVANYGDENILRVDSAGTVAEWGAGGVALRGPTGLAWGPDGDLYVASWDNGKLVRFDGATGGTPTVVINSGLSSPEQIAFDAAGDLYIANGADNEVVRWDGTSLTTYFTHPDLSFATGLAFGPDGQLYVSSFSNDRVLRYDGTTGAVFADDGVGGLDQPEYLAFTPAHQVVVDAGILPVLLTNTLSIDQADTVVLDAGVLSASDADDDDGLLVFTVSNVQNGWFATVSDVTTPITSFEQGEVAAGQVVFVHDGGELAPSYELSVSDGKSSTSASPATVSFGNGAEGVLWLSSKNDVGTGNGVPGLDGGGWTAGDILQQATPNLAFGEGTTDGTFSLAFDASDFASGANINGMHFVASDISIGGTNPIGLQVGDLILTTDEDETFVSNGAVPEAALAVGKDDLFFFRPDKPGDYSTGNFHLLMRDPFQNGAEIHGVTLVEKDVTVGETLLSAGDLLLARSGGGEGNDIWWMSTAGVDPADGLSFAGSIQRLIEGSDAGIDIEDRITGLDLLESDFSGGGRSYDAGTILITLDGDDDDGLGSNDQAAGKEDVIALLVSRTTLGSGAGSALATAELMFDGSDVNLDVDDGVPDALTLTVAPGSGNVAPTLENTLLAVNEGQTVTLTAAMLSASDLNDADGSLVFSVSAVNGGHFELAGNPGVAVFSFTQAAVVAGDVRFVDDGDEVAPSFDVEVSDGLLTAGPVAATVNFSNVNDVPTTSPVTLAPVAENSGPRAITAAELLVNASDAEGDGLDVTGLTVTAGSGILVNLGGGNWSFTPLADDDTAVTFSYTISDGTDTVPGSASLDITPVNSVPTVVTSLVFVSYTENAPPRATDPGITVADVDSATLIGASVRISGNYFSDQDVLSFVDQSGISGSWDAGTGTLVLTGVASVADYQSALRAVTYHNTSDAPSFLARTIEYAVVDEGSASSVPATRSLSVVSIPDPPALTVNTLSITQGGTVTLDGSMLAAVDPDDPYGDISFTVSAASNGWFADSGDIATPITVFLQSDITAGSIVFVHDGSELAPSYQITATSAGQVDGPDPATVSFDNVNAAPVIVGATLPAVDEDTLDPPGATVADLFGPGFVDPDPGASLAGVLLVADASIPAEGVWQYSTDGSHWFAIGAVGDDASALVLSAATEVRFLPAAGYSGVPGSLLLRALDNSYAGTYSDTIGGIETRVTADAGSNGGTTAVSATTVTLGTTVNALNDAPVADDESFTVVEGGSASEADLDSGVSLLDGDSDPDTGDTLVVDTTPVVGPSHGSLTLNADGSFSYTHDGSENFSDSFSYAVVDAAGNSDTATVTITITPVNDNPPTLLEPIPDQVATEDVAFRFTFTAGTFGDGDAGDGLRYAAELADGAALPAWLHFAAADRTFSGTPGDDDAGTLDIRVTATDGAGATVADVFRLRVVAVDDEPVIGNNRLVLEPGERVVINPGILSANDVDNDDADLVFTLTAVSGGQFERLSAPGVAITSFTQDELAAGEIVFVDDGDDVLPAYAVNVSDGANDVGPAVAEVRFLAAPVADPLPVSTVAEAVPESPVPPPALSTVTAAGGASEATADEAPPDEPAADETAPAAEDAVPEEPARPGFVSETDEAGMVPADTGERGAVEGGGGLQALLSGLLLKPVTGATLAVPTVGAPAFELDTVAAEVRSVLSSNAFTESLDRMRGDINNVTLFQQGVVGSGAAITTGLSVGYVAWLVRGGVLLSTALSALPAWQFIDPLPVLARSGRGEEDDPEDDSLESIIKNRGEADATRSEADAQRAPADDDKDR